MNDIPVSSRKYEVVRSLAERLIDENNKEGIETLREVNRAALSLAFARTLSQLEAAVVHQGSPDERAVGDGSGGSVSGHSVEYRLSRVLRAVRLFGISGSRRSPAGMSRSEVSAEKMAAELLWLAQKLAACGCAEEAISRWAVASNLAWLALCAEPRLQGSLVKISGIFIFL